MVTGEIDRLLSQATFIKYLKGNVSVTRRSFGEPHADFTDDLFKVKLEKVPNIEVAYTVVDGKIVYEKS